MKTLFKRAGKFLFLLIVLLLFIAGVAEAWISSWREDRIATLAAVSSIADTSAGPVEYVSSGDGPPVLVIHGAPGGYDQAALVGDNLVENGFRVIAPSRPGYLRTPLSSRVSPANQADAMAALLDKLGVTTVEVVSISAGTPVALEFARRYPGRVKGLVLISPAVGKAPAEAFCSNVPGDPAAWTYSETVRKNPAEALDTMLQTTSGLDDAQRAKIVAGVVGDPDATEWFGSLTDTLVPATSRDAGLKNDIAQIEQWQNFPYETVTAPVLMVHGDADRFLSDSDARAIAGRMPSATFLAVPDAGHIVQLGPRFQDTRNQITGFLRQHSGNPATP